MSVCLSEIRDRIQGVGYLDAESIEWRNQLMPRVDLGDVQEAARTDQVRRQIRQPQADVVVRIRGQKVRRSTKRGGSCRLQRARRAKRPELVPLIQDVPADVRGADGV